jgi:hypothetical protein
VSYTTDKQPTIRHGLLGLEPRIFDGPTQHTLPQNNYYFNDIKQRKSKIYMTIVSLICDFQNQQTTGFRLFAHKFNLSTKNDNAFTRSEVILRTKNLTVTMPLCQFNGTTNS